MRIQIIRRIVIVSIALFALSGCTNKKNQARIKELELEIETIQEENSANIEEREKEMSEKEDALNTKQNETAEEIRKLTQERDTAVQERDNLKNIAARAEAALKKSLPKDASSPGHADFDPIKVPKITDAVATVTGDKSSGSGVVVSADGKIYLYTAAQVVSGNSRLSVSNSAGFKFSKFGNLEVADGAEIVRLELLDAADAAVLQLVPEDTKVTSNTSITGIGSSVTSGTVTGERGKAISQSGDFIECDAPMIQGKIGGMLLENTTGKVLAIITNSGAERTNPIATPNATAESLFRACRLNRKLQWKAMTVKAFLDDAKKIIDADRMTRVCQTLVGLSPTNTGLSGINSTVAGGQSALDILTEAKDIPLASEVLNMHTQLSTKKSNISEIDLNKRFASLKSSAVNQMQRADATFDLAKFNSYHRRFADNSLKARKLLEQSLQGAGSGSGAAADK
jgi:hypothetical protein